METNIMRIKKDIENIAGFSDTLGNGVTRFSYSENDSRVRKYFISQMQELELDILIDGVGNIRGRLQGTDHNQVVMSGSHIDTVLNGGKFDGVTGAVAALEVIRVIKENHIQTKHPIEIILFAEEEGSNFGSTMTGSKSLMGEYTVEDFKKLKNHKGLSMYDVLKNFGLNPDDMPNHLLNPKEVKAMIELHIEQSTVLDTEKIPIGIVEKIAGMRTIKVTLEGIGNHAGAAPMRLRKDALVAASQMILTVKNIAEKECSQSTVATVGKIDCYPNVSNIIPETTSFTIDVRDVDFAQIEYFTKRFHEAVKTMSDEYGLNYEIEIIAESKGIQLGENIISTIKKAAEEKNIPYKSMNSGAVHDACLLGKYLEAGMIFVPSINGRSHVPEENTPFEDIKLGCDVLLASILELAK